MCIGKTMNGRVTATVLGVLCGAWLASAEPAFAVVPQTMSYQAVLTDAAGVLLPDGNYDLTFKLYTVASGGTPVWTESRPATPVVLGGVAVTLGSVTPLSVPFDVPYYLGIAVGTDPELTPRVALAASPYALSLRLPFSGSANVSGAAFSVRNTSPSNLPDISAYRTLHAGGASSGKLRIFGPASGLAAELGDFDSPGGGYLHINDQTGNPAVRIVSRSSGGGGIDVMGAPGAGGVTMFGGPGPQLGVSDQSRFCFFVPGFLGDNAVLVPDGAISSQEMLNEAGISQGIAPSQIFLTATPGSTTGVVSTTLTVPTSGYITAEADMHMGINPGVTVSYQIGRTLGTFDGAINLANNPAGSIAYVPTSARRTYFVSAGTHTFYFHAQASAASAAYASNSRITATFVPTSYGSVSDLLVLPDASAFSHRTPVGPRTEAGVPALAPTAIVDLRELEQRVDADRAALMRSTLELLLAQARERQVKAGQP